MDDLNPLQRHNSNSNNSQINMSGSTGLNMQSRQAHQSQISDEHIEESDILTPHYVIVEDPISIHSYADLSGVSLASDFTMPVDKDHSAVTAERKGQAGNYQMFPNTDAEVMSFPDDVRQHVRDGKAMKRETILAVPVLSIPKHSTNVGKNIGNNVEIQNPFSVSKLNKFNMEDGKVRSGLPSGVSGTEHNFPIDNFAKRAEDLNNVLDECQMESGEKTLSKFKDSSRNGMSNEDNFRDKSLQSNVDKDKTMFSENLGLIPADAEEKLIAQRAKKAYVGVRTRKSLGCGTNVSRGKTIPKEAKEGSSRTVNLSQPSNNVDLNDSPPTSGHKHKAGSYRCGSCARSFTVICKLHDHLQEHCFGGSYHYDHMLKTAFPKYDTTCSYAQTNFDFDDEPSKKPQLVKEKIRSRLKFRAPKIKANMRTAKKTAAILGKRKRGRPRKGESVEEIGEKSEQIPDGSNEDMDVSQEIVSDDDAAFDKKEHFLNDSLDLISKDDLKDGKTDNLLKKLDDNVEDDVEGGKKSRTDSDEKTRSQKRKMSIPRKIMKNGPSEEDDKVINSRTKPENKIKCEYCPSEFQYTRGLIRHEHEKHADKMQYQCDQCDQRFMRQYNLERHKLCTHRSSKAGFAQERKGIYRDKGEKKQVNRKSQEKVQESSTACDICGADIPDSKMDVHVRLHTGERPYICHVCGKGLISDKKLKRHLLIHSEIQRHTCDVCGEGFAMKYKLRTHMFIHTGHKPYLCSVCGSEFNNSTSLLHHNRTVHLGDKRFECTVCGGRYGKKSQLEEHMFSHSEERTQTCRYCGKTFKHAKSLRRHESSHVSDTKFECDQCDSKFSRKDNLERHKMCHYDTTLQCSYCKKKFRERQPLLDHEQFHVNQKKFQCQLCKDKFQEETYFYNHMEKNHGVARDMVQVVNALANSPAKETKSRKVPRNNSVQNVIIDRLKLNPESDYLGLSESRAIDTLNRCMSAAGILPTTSTNQELGNIDQSTLQVGGQNQNNVLNPTFNVGLNSIGMSHAILNPNVNQNYTSAGTVAPGMNNTQRITLNSINVGESGTIRLTLDQPESTLGLGSESTILSDQQRLLQDVSAIHNLQDQGYRMPNMY